MKPDPLAALHYLERRQKTDGAICDDAHPGFNVWETILAARAIHAWAQEASFEAGPLLIRALHFLFRAENSAGMVYHNDTDEFPDTYCLETSAEYIQLMLALYPSVRPEIRAKLAFVRQAQLDSGEWNVVNPTVPEDFQRFPSVTAYALKALALGEIVPIHENAALDALLDTQATAGHWGANWMVYGTPNYALALVLEALAPHRANQREEQSMERAQEFLRESQQPDGSWHRAVEGAVRQPSAELHTALALQACLSTGLGPASETVQRGTAWLLGRQRPDGSWDGGFFPTPADYRTVKREDVYATAQALLALHRCLP